MIEAQIDCGLFSLRVNHVVPPPLLILVVLQHVYGVDQLVLGVQQIQIVVVVGHQLLCVLRRKLLATCTNK